MYYYNTDDNLSSKSQSSDTPCISHSSEGEPWSIELVDDG